MKTFTPFQRVTERGPEVAKVTPLFDPKLVRMNKAHPCLLAETESDTSHNGARPEFSNKVSTKSLSNHLLPKKFHTFTKLFPKFL